MQKITPHLWFDKEAKEATQFYVDTFGGDSKVTSVETISDTPSGDTDIVSFTLAGQDFMAISAGPLFKFNPSISFLVSCVSADEVQQLWDKLRPGGSELMPLDKYPFSEKYGWLQDKYGLSWQLMHMPEHHSPQKITPTLMFVGEVCGKAEEAANYYTTIFHDAKVGNIMRYGTDEAPDKEGTVKHLDLTLEGYQLAAMDSAREHDFTFNEAVSLIVNCKDQAEVDHYWQLSAVPESEQCGWLKDRYGVSWQIVPEAMGEMMSSGDQAAVARVTQAFLKMKKFDVAELEKAFRG